MTTKELRSLKPGTRVVWNETGETGVVRCADNGGRRSPRPAMWIEWEDHQHTEDFDDWALKHVEVKLP